MRVHVHDELLQRGIAHHLALEVRKIHADEQQRLRSLRPGTRHDHPIEVRAIHRRSSGLLAALRINHRRHRLAFVPVTSHALVIPSDHHFITHAALFRIADQIRADPDLPAIRDPFRYLHRLQHPPRQICER